MNKTWLISLAFAGVAAVFAAGLLLTQGGDEDPVSRTKAVTAPAGATPYGVFEGRVPCGAVCERIKVRLTLFRDAATNAPTEYVLERIYVGQGNDRHTTRGRWRTLDGPKPFEGAAFRLDDASPPDFATYLPIGDVLLILGEDLQPRVGDASHSFTLSRTR
jgi:hypothetical protein